MSSAVRRNICLSLLCVIPCSASVALQNASARDMHRGRAAGSVSVNTAVSTHLVSHSGATVLHESGNARGTLSCPSLTIQIKVAYTDADINFTCTNSSGTLTGQGETSFYASGKLAHFNGYLRISHGTGGYARSVNSKLSIVGTLYRGSYAISAAVKGTLNL